MRSIAVFSLACVVLIFTGAAQAQWATYQGDPAHDGYVPGVLPTSAPHVLWTTTVGSVGLVDLSSLAIGGGNVYVASTNNDVPLTALNATTGAISWQHSFGSEELGANPPAFANGMLYVQAGAGSGPSTTPELFAFDASTGTTKFQSTFGEQFDSYLAPTIVNGNVFINGGTFGGMYSFNGTTGAQNWFNSTLPQFDGWTPSIANGMCYSYTGSGTSSPESGKFNIINAATGATISTTTDSTFAFNSYTMNETPALGSQNDAFVTNGNRLIKFGTTSAGGILSILTDNYTGQPTVANGVVYVQDLDSIVALNESTGAKLWSWTSTTPGYNPDGHMIVTDDLLFAQAGATVNAINAQTGQLVWSLAESDQQMALSNGVLYLSSVSGTVTAIAVPEPASGAIALMAIGLLTLRRRQTRREILK